MRYLVLIALFFSLQLRGEPLKLSIGAEGAILMNARTGAILFEKKAHEPTYPASTTKIATALYALHKYQQNLAQIATAQREAIASITPQAKKQSNYRSPPHWLETDGSHIGIKKGEELRLYDLLNAMLIASANDASNVIAQHVEGTIPKFMHEVNLYLKKIGCLNTSFNNPHGLHHPDHFTTPYDLAIMAKEGLKNPVFRRIVSTTNYTCPQTNLEYERTFSQTNLLLKKGIYHYPKAIGVKTGTTQMAGKNLVAAAEENGRLLIAVALGYRGTRSELYQDVIKMFEAAFKEQKMRRYLLPQGAQKLTTKVFGAKGTLKTVLPEGLYYDFFLSEETGVKAKVNWKVPVLPVAKGGVVGLIQIVDEGGNLLKETPLFALEELKPNFWYRSHQFFSAHKQFLFWIGVVSLLFFFWLMRRKKHHHRPLYK